MCLWRQRCLRPECLFDDCSTHRPIPLVSLSPDIVVVFHLLLETLWISGSHHWCMACTIPQAPRMWAFQDCQSFFYPHVSQNLPIATVIGQILPRLKMVAKGPDAIVIGQILTCLKMVAKGGAPKTPHSYQLEFQSCVNTLLLPHPDAIVIGQILPCLKMVGKGSAM